MNSRRTVLGVHGSSRTVGDSSPRLCICAPVLNRQKPEPPRHKLSGYRASPISISVKQEQKEGIR
jgi:hypothetical protein